VVAYYQSFPLREEVLPLLQVLTAQAASVLENMQLVGQVIEARTEASKLLKWALDDHRLRVSILESISSGVILLDMEGNITTYNASARAILGYAEKNVVGQTIDHILPLRSLPLHEEIRTPAMTETDMIRHEVIQATHSDGHPLVLDTSSVILRTNRGRQIGVLVTFSDVTSLHQLEEEKRRLDRLATLGQMSANIAHEVRNPLASIKMALQIMLRESDDLLTTVNLEENVQEMKESMNIALEEVDRLNNLVDELLFFAKPKQIHRSPVDIRTILDRVLILVQKQVEIQDVIVERSYQDIQPISIDASQIEQVLLNIYTNALQAMPNGGGLYVSTSIVTIGQELASSPSLQLALPLPVTRDFQHPLQYIELVIRDTGCGIATDHIAHIGQPFFTTKAHGMGLGMAISKRLMEEHHGWLNIQSRVGEGTTLILYLPLEEEL
jgi:PAS domain S-box-containing protein